MPKLKESMLSPLPHPPILLTWFPSMVYCNEFFIQFNKAESQKSSHDTSLSLTSTPKPWSSSIKMVCLSPSSPPSLAKLCLFQQPPNQFTCIPSNPSKTYSLYNSKSKNFNTYYTSCPFTITKPLHILFS